MQAFGPFRGQLKLLFFFIHWFFLIFCWTISLLFSFPKCFSAGAFPSFSLSRRQYHLFSPETLFLTCEEFFPRPSPGFFVLSFPLSHCWLTALPAGGVPFPVNPFFIERRADWVFCGTSSDSRTAVISPLFEARPGVFRRSLDHFSHRSYVFNPFIHPGARSTFLQQFGRSPGSMSFFC